MSNLVNIEGTEKAEADAGVSFKMALYISFLALLIYQYAEFL